MTIGEKKISKFYIGQSSSIERTFTERDVKSYMELTREENSVYSDDVFMKKVQLKGRVVPGLLSEGLIMEVSSKELPGSPGLLLQKELIYHHPVYIGDNITAKVEIIDIDLRRRWITLMVQCTNQLGEVVITGQIVALVIINTSE
ncbi:MaoC/PaaZ C-terminal domain-containing protein [Psychrobacillus sp. NPDC096426]|uniref:MaoC/PaaZ C-terminal domain-containing protein n=1 Tax=Psychrobacillus sp. NPDC096426 TaxID=3364491 RepID=UPI0038051859